VEAVDGAVFLRVDDDGVGFDPAGIRPQALGILGMRERAHRLGGEFSVERGERAGAVVVVRIPLRER
jgi:signal transduction histidine kinase